MKRLFIAIQWIVVAFLLTTLVVFFFRKDAPPEYQPSSWKSWNGFYALAVEGVLDSEDPRYLTPAKLDEYLHALREAGYKTIAPQDVEGYYYRDQPLPEKAVLLMFEGGRKDHIIRATPRLVKNRSIGTLFVPTSVTKRWGNHFVDRANLRRISRSAHWRLASMGHEAIDMIKISRDGEKGHFLSTREWKQHGRESDGTFQDRIYRDYEKAAYILRRATGRPAVAYLYPFGDAGEGKRADSLAETINQGAVRQYHKVAFTQEGRPFNNYISNPHSLSRLRVKGDWSGEELVQKLDQWEPDARRVEGFENTRRWELGDECDVIKGALRVNVGGSALLRGSGAWRNVNVEALLDVPSGAIGILYLRYSGPHSYLRITFQQSGIRIQEKRAGKMQTLSWLLLNMKNSESHNVSVRLKDNRLWVEHNGVAFARAIPVSRKTKSGFVWIGAEGDSVTCANLLVNPIEPLFAIGADYHGMNDAEKNQSTVLLPFWYKAGDIQQLNESEQLAVMLAAQEGLSTIPVIQVDERMDYEEARALAAELQEKISALTVRMLIREFAVTGYQPELHKAFGERGMWVSYVVSVEEAEDILGKGTLLKRYERMVVRGNEERVLSLGKKYQSSLPPGKLVLETKMNAALPEGVEQAVALEASK